MAVEVSHIAADGRSLRISGRIWEILGKKD
jgi:hypothetical protein